MKQFLLLAGLLMTGQLCFAETKTESADSDKSFMSIVDMEKVSVSSTRAGENTPIAHTDMSKEEIRERNNGLDMPFLLTSTPSVVVTSDAGAGIGYTGIRIRGTDATRINVTLNGIPMNDAESHGLFWVNTPDLAASLEDIQIQRGVGTSTNGAGSFGGSINMRSELFGSDPFLSVSGTYGSYGTHRESIDLGTGFIGNSRWAFNTRLSNIGSDGYLDRASTKLKSYFFQAGYFGQTTTLRFINFGGKEETYHAWNGISQDEIDEFGRKYNSSGAIEDENGDVIGFYKDQTDNYIQSNYQVLLNQYLATGLSLNAGLHYTSGDGYYEEYKNGRSLEEYGLTPFLDPATSTMVTESNLVRQKKMDNWFGGGTFSLDYQSNRLTASFGGAANKYDGDHFGKVIWVQNYAGDASFQPDHEYYRNNGKKVDYNVYLRADWAATEKLSLYGDLQYRHIDYKIKGANDNWDWNNSEMQVLDIDENFDFFNPKAGVNYRFCPNFNAYASVAVAHKEPTRNNYTDADLSKMPKRERLLDYEAGVNYRSDRFIAGANFYYMDYRDQLVLTGKVNHIGEPLSENVRDSYRAGIELTAGAKITDWLRWDVNATFSRNRIKGYTEYLDDVDANFKGLYTQTANYVGNTDIGFSPEVLAGSLITARYKGARLALQSNYVGKQYLSNAGQKEIRLDDYFVNNLRVDYTFKLPSVKSVNVGVSVNNIFDEKYSSNGFAWSANVISAPGVEARADIPYYFPQARTNVLANITLNF